MRDKQIKNMAEEILQEYTNCYNEVDQECLEKMLYKLASDVAREIFEEIEKALDNSVETEHFKGTWFNFSKFKQRLAELKKKYESEGEG